MLLQIFISILMHESFNTDDEVGYVF